MRAALASTLACLIVFWHLSPGGVALSPKSSRNISLFFFPPSNLVGTELQGPNVLWIRTVHHNTQPHTLRDRTMMDMAVRRWHKP